jgi:SatD family (SatD)
MEKKAAVLTGDIIRSSDLSPEKREQLQVALNEAFSEAARLTASFKVEQFRGDSFQAVLDTQPEEALRTLLLIIAHLHLRQFGVRIALGLGTVSYESDSILTSDGSAFQASGPALDDLKKKNQLLAIAGPSDSFNQEWRVHALTMDYLLSRWTVPQAEAVLGQLQGLTQEETARRLQIKQPAVQQRLQAVGWPVIEAILERFVPSVHGTLL